MDSRLASLISPLVEHIMKERVPRGYVQIQNVDNLYKNELEKIVRALETPPSVPAGNGNVWTYRFSFHYNRKPQILGLGGGVVEPGYALPKYT